MPNLFSVTQEISPKTTENVLLIFLIARFRRRDDDRIVTEAGAFGELGASGKKVFPAGLTLSRLTRQDGDCKRWTHSVQFRASWVFIFSGITRLLTAPRGAGFAFHDCLLMSCFRVVLLEPILEQSSGRIGLPSQTFFVSRFLRMCYVEPLVADGPSLG